MKRKHGLPLNRVTLSAFACDVMRDFGDFDPQKGWEQVRGKDDETQRRYGEFVMLLRVVERFNLDLREEPTK